MKPALLVPVGLTLASRALAQADTSSTLNLEVGGQNPADGPANATGTSTFRGPDLTRRPGGVPYEHEVSISVYAEVDANGTRPGALTAVSVVTLHDADAGEAEDGWSACLSVWESRPGVSDGGGLDDPGDCSAVLSDSCRNEFPSFFDQDNCQTTDLDGDCASSLGSGFATSREIGDSAPIFISKSAPFDAGDDKALMEAYAAEVSRVWIMQLSWSRSDDPGTTFTEYSGPVCFQANHIAEGSVDPRDRDEGGDGDGDGGKDGDGDTDEDDSGGERLSVGGSTGWGAAVALGLLVFL